MKLQSQSDRKSRVRMMIQAAGLLQKSGLLEAFHVPPRDDLQDYNNRDKTAALFGFFTECFEKHEFDEDNLERWRTVGERILR